MSLADIIYELAPARSMLLSAQPKRRRGRPAKSMRARKRLLKYPKNRFYTWHEEPLQGYAQSMRLCEFPTMHAWSWM
jgi:hypothetical protein